MNVKDIAISALVAVVLVTGVSLFTEPVNVVVNVPESKTDLGSSGSIFSEIQYFLGGFTSGGEFDSDDSIPVLSGTLTDTATAAEICDSALVVAALDDVNSVVTFPSASALNDARKCLWKFGSRKEFAIYNASSTGNVGFAAGASSTILLTNATTSLNATSTINSHGLLNVVATRITSSTPYSATGQPWIIYEVTRKSNHTGN